MGELERDRWRNCDVSPLWQVFTARHSHRDGQEHQWSMPTRGLIVLSLLWQVKKRKEDFSRDNLGLNFEVLAIRLISKSNSVLANWFLSQLGPNDSRRQQINMFYWNRTENSLSSSFQHPDHRCGSVLKPGALTASLTHRKTLFSRARNVQNKTVLVRPSTVTSDFSRINSHFTKRKMGRIRCSSLVWCFRCLLCPPLCLLLWSLESQSWSEPL